MKRQRTKKKTRRKLAETCVQATHIFFHVSTLLINLLSSTTLWLAVLIFSLTDSIFRITIAIWFGEMSGKKSVIVSKIIRQCAFSSLFFSWLPIVVDDLSKYHKCDCVGNCSHRLWNAKYEQKKNERSSIIYN